MCRNRAAAQKTALFGILSAQALALSFLEGLLPAFLPVQGMKIGFSNIVTMYCVSSLGIPYALAVTVFKAFFALVTRGASASLLSLSGGLLSLLGMIVLLRLKPFMLGFIGIGTVSALLHNAGQLFVCVFLVGKTVFALSPVLIVLSVVTGILTGAILKYTLPLLQKQYALMLNSNNKNSTQER